MTTKTIITLGRQFGSGGRAVGKKLAEDLGIPYYDKEILQRAAKESGICESLFENHDEKPTSSFLYSLVMDTYSAGYATMGMQEMPMSQKVFLAQFDTIKKIAEEGPCVIVGRCADYILRSRPDVLRVFIYADRDIRKRRAVEEYGVLAENADEFMYQNDKRRRIHYENYTNQKWGSRENYDLLLNSGDLGIERCVELICAAVK